MGCILTQKHTSHNIVSLLEAKHYLTTQVNAKFASDIESAVYTIESLTKTVDVKLEKLQYFENSFVESLENTFEELFTALRETYTTLKEQMRAKFKTSFHQRIICR